MMIIYGLLLTRTGLMIQQLLRLLYTTIFTLRATHTAYDNYNDNCNYDDMNVHSDQLISDHSDE